jgi:hypothetical protein
MHYTLRRPWMTMLILAWIMHLHGCNPFMSH